MDDELLDEYKRQLSHMVGVCGLGWVLNSLGRIFHGFITDSEVIGDTNPTANTAALLISLASLYPKRTGDQ